MAVRFRSQLENLDRRSFASMVTAAMAVACADGTLEAREVQELGGSIAQLTEGLYTLDELGQLLASAVDVVQSNGVASTIKLAAANLAGDPMLSEVAFLLAASVAFSGRGVNKNESAVLVALAQSLGIGPGAFNALVAEGKQLAAS